jgi:hypothetical protein
MTCGVVATSISGCDLCTVCRVQSLKYLLPQRRISYKDVFFADQFHNIVA